MRRSWGALRPVVPGTAATVVYAAIALFAYRTVLFASTSSLPDCNCGDQAQEVWFLRWPLYAVTHGMNPFFSAWMNYPKGVNVALNTSAPLLGIISAPAQLTIGPVATFSVMLVLSFTASALSMCLALRRWVRTWPAAFVGGLLYGFSPFMIGQGQGHLFLLAEFVPPIVLVVVADVISARHSARRDGLLLGLLLAAQYYISPEMLAMTVVMVICGVAVLAIARPAEARRRARHVATAALFCVVVCAALVAYPAWYALRGPGSVVGPPHPLSGLADFPGDLLGPVVPTSNQVLAPLSAKIHGDALVGHNPTENGLYLGVPLVLLLVVFARVFRRVRPLLYFVVMAAVAGILALGPRLVVDGHPTPVRLPFDVLYHVPVLQDMLPVRFSLFMQLFAAAALAIGLEETARWAAERGTSWLGAHRAVAPGVVGLVGLVALAPLVPSLPYPSAATAEPAFFSSAAVDRIPPRAPVLAYPYPLLPLAEWNLTFQAQADMRFKLIGGFAFVPGPGGRSVSTPTPLRPTVVEHLFSDAYDVTESEAMLGTPPGTAPPRVDGTTTSALRTFLRRYRVDAVVVDDLGQHPETVVTYVSDVLGPPTTTGGVWAWFDVPRLLERPASQVTPGQG